MYHLLTVFSEEKKIFFSTVRYLTFIISRNHFSTFNFVLLVIIFCSNAFDAQFIFLRYIILSLTFRIKKKENKSYKPQLI